MNKRFLRKDAPKENEKKLLYRKKAIKQLKEDKYSILSYYIIITIIFVVIDR